MERSQRKTTNIKKPEFRIMNQNESKYGVVEAINHNYEPVRR